MDKHTKIVATIGPASDTPEKIKELIQSGVNIFRFNFKHNTVEWHRERIARVTAISAQLKQNIGILIDLQGPEIRLKMLEESMTLKKGDEILLDEKELCDNNRAISISHTSIIKHLKDGQKLVADDGYFEFRLKKRGNKTFLVSQSEGLLKTNKTLNIPSANFPFPVLINRDFEGLRLAEKGKINYIALSFVRDYSDIEILRKEMINLKLKAKIIAKIETTQAIANINSIINEADGIMIARGDLGVEMPIEQVPYYQKQIIRKCIEKGVPVITATQMMESMIMNPLPTRAEVSDIANAVYDFSDAVMLSAESASGKYPVKAVKVMARTLAFNESKELVDLRKLYNFKLDCQETRITDAAYNLYLQSNYNRFEVRAFVIFTQSGRTARLVSRYRPLIPIYAFCPTKQVADSLSINFGIEAYVQEESYQKTVEVTRIHIEKTLAFLTKHGLVSFGDKLIVIHGDYWTIEGGSSTVKLVEVQ